MPNSQSLTLPQALPLVVKFLNENNLQQAENLCRQILQTIPNQPDALHLLGIIAYRTQHHEHAVKLIQQTIVHQPTFIEAYYNLATILKKLEQYQESIKYYEKGLAIEFNLGYPFDLEKSLMFLCQSMTISRWQARQEHLVNYGHCLYQVGNLQKIGDQLSFVANHLNLSHFNENEAQFMALFLLRFLKFDKLTDRAWNTQVFEQFALPVMKQALAIGYYELGLTLENYIYGSYVKQKETEENFRTCFGQWVGDMCAAGRKVKETLPPLDRSVLNDTVPMIGFFIHNASLLAHIEVLLNMLEGLSQLENQPFKPIIYAFGGYHEGLLARCQKINVPVVFFSQWCPEKGNYARLLFLRQQVIKDKISALVWISLAVMMPFAFSMRVAPVQIWWAMKYHGVEFDEIDGYIANSNFGESKKIDNKIWRTSPAGRRDWYQPELALQAQKIRSQYQPFEIILGSMGREEKLDSSEFIETVAKILQKYPKVAFLWTGKHPLNSIQSIFDRYNVSNQCFFIGWVNTKLYAQVLDIFLDSFPFPCGFTLFETMAAGKAMVLYACQESYETGIAGNISPVLSGQLGTIEEQKLMRSLFFKNEESLYFCANSSDQYLKYACQLIESEHLREKSGYANNQFVVHFFQDIRRMGSGYARHFLEIINECQQRLLK